MTQIDPTKRPPVQSSDGVTRFAVHRDGDFNLWWCEAHTFVEPTSGETTIPICVTCGQEPHHPVHDVRAYGLIHPKA